MWQVGLNIARKKMGDERLSWTTLLTEIVPTVLSSMGHSRLTFPVPALLSSLIGAVMKHCRLDFKQTV